MSFSLSKELWGSLAVLASAFFFYLSTAAIRWAKSEVTLPPSFFMLSRFCFGLLIVVGVILWKRRKLMPKRHDLLLGRAFTNALAVYCFFKAVDLTTVAEANILNMTYPVFIALFVWVSYRKAHDWMGYLLAILAFVGIFCVLSPDQVDFSWHSLWGLASGVTAAVSILLLNFARQDNDTETLLFFMFGWGLLLTLPWCYEVLRWPSKTELFYLSLSSGFGVAGQYLLTLGAFYVTPVEGGIISSSRILIAAVLGPYLAGDPALTPLGWLGAFLIFGTNVYLAWRKVS